MNLSSIRTKSLTMLKLLGAIAIGWLIISIVLCVSILIYEQGTTDFWPSMGRLLVPLLVQGGIVVASLAAFAGLCYGGYHLWHSARCDDDFPDATGWMLARVITTKGNVLFFEEDRLTRPAKFQAEHYPDCYDTRIERPAPHFHYSIPKRRKCFLEVYDSEEQARKEWHNKTAGTGFVLLQVTIAGRRYQRAGMLRCSDIKVRVVIAEDVCRSCLLGHGATTPATQLSGCACKLGYLYPACDRHAQMASYACPEGDGISHLPGQFCLTADVPEMRFESTALPKKERPHGGFRRRPVKVSANIASPGSPLSEDEINAQMKDIVVPDTVPDDWS